MLLQQRSDPLAWPLGLFFQMEPAKEMISKKGLSVQS